MPSLYLLTEIYNELLGLLDECQSPEEAAGIIEQIAQVNESVGDKAEAYARIIQSKQREADGYEVEIKRMQARKKTAENLIERLRVQLLTAMTDAGATKIGTSIGVWSVRKNPESVAIVDAALIPPEFLEPQPAKIDKRAILKAHRETGEIFPGVEFVQAARVEFK